MNNNDTSVIDPFTFVDAGLLQYIDWNLWDLLLSDDQDNNN